MGYVVCDKSLYTKLSCAAGNVVVASNLAQMVMARYMERYDLDAHIQKACDYYGKKACAMKDALDRCLPEGWVRTDPEGGLFMWVTHRSRSMPWRCGRSCFPWVWDWPRPRPLHRTGKSPDTPSA